MSNSSGKPVSNKIAEALIERICRAIEEGENFRVVVVIPLMPGFEGEIYEKNSNLMRIQLSWEYRTINRGKNSIIERYTLPAF